MFPVIEPGILDAAHSKGIKFLGDMNHDGKIDGKDLNLALAAKAKAGTAADATVNK
jgi:hypothetical protein